MLASPIQPPSRFPPEQLISTTDLFATLASVGGYRLPDDAATDSFDMLPVMLGMQDESEPVRPHLLTQSFRGEFQLRQGDWKYCDHPGSGGNRYDQGFLKEYAFPQQAPEAPGQLYRLSDDPGETMNLYFIESERRERRKALLEELKSSGRSAPAAGSHWGSTEFQGWRPLGKSVDRRPCPITVRLALAHRSQESIEVLLELRRNRSLVNRFVAEGLTNALADAVVHEVSAGRSQVDFISVKFRELAKRGSIGFDVLPDPFDEAVGVRANDLAVRETSAKIGEQPIEVGFVVRHPDRGILVPFGLLLLVKRPAGVDQ